jgi:hypothetical protein
MRFHFEVIGIILQENFLKVLHYYWHDTYPQLHVSGLEKYWHPFTWVKLILQVGMQKIRIVVCINRFNFSFSFFFMLICVHNLPSTFSCVICIEWAEKREMVQFYTWRLWADCSAFRTCKYDFSLYCTVYFFYMETELNTLSKNSIWQGVLGRIYKICFSYCTDLLVLWILCCLFYVMVVLC